MTAINGKFFASGSSDSCLAILSFAEEGGISVELENRIQVYSESYFEVEPELGRTPRVIRFNDGSLFETTDLDAFKAFESQLKRKPLIALVSLLERNWRTATASVVAVGVFCVLFFMYGIPAIAMHVAGVVPQSLRVKMSEDTMRLMSKTKVLEASEIDSERRDTLEKIFFDAIKESGFSRDTEYEYKLSFRNAPYIGKNAFALPSGEIVFTDDLVEACSDEQILSIMLHEIAHVELQHGIRSLIQNSGIIIIITLAIGDANGVSNLVSSLPTLLAESHYSQKFEIEADSFSCRHLQNSGYSPDLLGDSLKILHEGAIEMPLEDLLSTHPSLKARLANIEKSKLSRSELRNQSIFQLINRTSLQKRAPNFPSSSDPIRDFFFRRSRPTFPTCQRKMLQPLSNVSVFLLIGKGALTIGQGIGGIIVRSAQRFLNSEKGQGRKQESGA